MNLQCEKDFLDSGVDQGMFLEIASEELLILSSL